MFDEGKDIIREYCEDKEDFEERWYPHIPTSFGTIIHQNQL